MPEAVEQVVPRGSDNAKLSSKEVRSFSVPAEAYDLIRHLVGLGVYESIDDYARQAFMKQFAETKKQIQTACKNGGGGGKRGS